MRVSNPFPRWKYSFGDSYELLGSSQSVCLSVWLPPSLSKIFSLGFDLYIRPPTRHLHVPQSPHTQHIQLLIHLPSFSLKPVLPPQLVSFFHWIAPSSTEMLKPKIGSHQSFQNLVLHWLLNLMDSLFSRFLKTILSFSFPLPSF